MTGGSPEVAERGHELFSLVFDSAVTGMVLVDGEGRFLRANQAHCELLGRTEEELRDLDVAAVTHPDDRSRTAEQFRRLRAGDIDSFRQHKRYVRPTGEVVWALVLCTAVRGEDGAVRFAVAQVLDLTRQRRLEETTSRFFSLSLDLLSTATYEGRLRRVNPAWSRTLGWSEEELMSRPVFEFVHPDDRARTEAEWGRLVSGGAPTVGFENRYCHADGSYRWLLWSARASPGERLVYAVAKDVTERRESEERVRASERRLADAQRVARVGSFEWDLTPGEYVWSRELFRIFGIEPHGRAPSMDDTLAMVVPEDRGAFATAVEEAATHQRPFEGDYRILRGDGELRTVHVRAVQVRGPRGEVAGMRGTAQDVTDVRAAEEKIRASARRLAEAQRIGRVGSFEWDLETDTIEWSDELFRIFGVEPRESGLSFAEVLAMVHPEDRAMVTAEGAAVLERPRSVSLEFRIVRPDGEARSFHVKAEPVVRDDGARPGLRGRLQDVTDLKLAEQRLRHSEAKYRGVVEATYDVIWSLDLDGRLTFMNSAVRHVYGYEPEEMLGRHFTEFSPPEQVQADLEAFERIMEGSPDLEYETRQIRKDGSSVWLSVKGAVVHDAEGRPVGATGVLRDVTDRKRGEERQDALSRLGQHALEAAGIPDLLREAAAIAEEGLRGDLVVVLEHDPENDALRVVAEKGERSGDVRNAVGVAPDSAAGAAFLGPEPVVVDDWLEEERFPVSAHWMLNTRVRSSVAVPIYVRGAPFGVLGVLAQRPAAFGPTEITFLQAIANVLGAAIDRKRSEAEIEELAAAVERARDAVERTAAQLRELVGELHPVTLAHAGLETALRAAAERQGRRGGFQWTVEMQGDGFAARDQLVLALASEALTNAAKHAEATSVSIRVARRGDDIVLEVADDGRGIEPGRTDAALREGHIGLASSAERVEAIGGSFELETSPGGGTLVRAVIPVR